jgi:phosphoenolpyruvate---glycerone phosphotransferase subunit DhaL
MSDKRGAVTAGERRTQRTRRANDGRFDRTTVSRWIGACAEEMAANRDFLTQLDAATGDADHGVNMDRGFAAAVTVAAAASELPPGELLVEVGSTIVLRVGGAAGPLYGTAFREMGASLGAVARFGLVELTDALEAGLDGIVRLGAAVDGDKTMVDAWAPAVEALRRNGKGDPATALRLARTAAEAGATRTVPMQARKGRASYLGPRSVGHQDPGATSTALVFAALQRSFEVDG